MSIVSLYTEKYGKIFAKQVIESYMKQQKMASAEELLKYNPTVNDFAQNSQLLNIIRTHGYFILGEQEYQDIVSDILKEEQQRNHLNTNDLQTTVVDGHEIITYTDTESQEQITLDNTISNRSIEQQMQNIQKDHEQFRQKNTNNTLNVMNYMRDNIKITPNTNSSTDIVSRGTVNEDSAMMKAIQNFENEIGHTVDIDLNGKMIYDNGMVYSIEKREDEYQIILQTKHRPKENKGPQLIKRKNNYNRVA